MQRLLVIVLLAGCMQPAGEPATPVPTPEAAEDLALTPLWDGFDRPLLVVHDGDAHYIVEQCGRVLVDGEVWLDIRGQVSCGGERGLLGFAFAPDGRAYVSYTDDAGDSVLSRWDGEEEVLMRVDQPASNHNGGHIAFGPDGYLYYGLGDGGGGGDAYGNGQDPDTLLGTILRIDVSGPAGYDVPPDNPFDGEAPEVWAYGLRNPWRFSFDAESGDLWIGDVGEGAWEEIDHQDAGSEGGENYGWPVWEGRHRFSSGDAPGHVPPVAEYPNRGDDCSVTGGIVIRDPELPDWDGTYIFGDFCSGIIRFVVPDGDGWATGILMETGLRISSFSEGPAGEVYVVDHGGTVYRLE